MTWDEAGDVDAIALPGAPPPSLQPATPPPLVTATIELVNTALRGRAAPSCGAAYAERAARTPLDASIYTVVSDIPLGTTLTYSEVARRAGRPNAARAVGAAMARNPFAPVIPCHRVVGSDGSLRGYAGGLEMKQRLLDLEAAHAG